jgi:hypothetical protein
MKQWTLLLVFIACTLTGFTQDEEEVSERRGFKKENLFTGGSLSLGFGNRSFTVGVSPVFGYKIADWIDAGLVANYQYTSYKDYYYIDDKLRQSTYGGGVFTRLYPVNFLFAQAQFEHNFITLKYIPANGGSTEKLTTSANSFLVGAGYAEGRVPGMPSSFFSLAVLVDLSGNENSPYMNNQGKPVPIFRAGLNIYPFRPSRSY